MKESTANKQIARAAGTVMIAILFGQIAGLVRGILVARTFGASPELDAFFAANRVSETLFLLVAGGALGSAFIPMFTGLLARDDKVSAWRLASSIANAVTLTLSLLAALIAFFAPQVVHYTLGLSNDPEIFALTISLLRIQLISTILFGLGGLIVGILNAHQIFLVPALTPAMYQLGIIFGAVFLSPTMGIYGLAWGVVIGALLYLLVLLPTLFKQKGTYTFTLDFNNSNTRQVFLLMGPRLLGVAVVQLNFWVNLRLASQMPFGSITGLNYGFSLMLMAQAVIAQSVAIAVMPTFSAQHALGQNDEMRASLASTLRGVIFLALPASIGLILLREPLISMLYQRGEFDARAVQLVAWALLWYAAGMVGHSIMEILTRAFYAQHDTKTPVMIGVIAMGLNVIFSILFARLFASIGWMPHGGLALANSFATALEAAALFFVMRKRLNGIDGGQILNGIGLAALGVLSMSVVIAGCLYFGKNLSAWILTPIGVIFGGGVYISALWILRVPELQYMVSGVLRRLKNR
ncbi:murein biosynthesis integral membrane protein MurJ [Candidatus Villigracilis saccharophilus]|uniref:murein biosynthesis integral membrane protein MurJ n=1 Tax=Candidatus Villigracilis saccharophilus TaxID=3140684 RepID=UPI003136D106|nr:murein biosynthesis integral membrane protein MurJ [Anaerolineales bacterium]